MLNINQMCKTPSTKINFTSNNKKKQYDSQEKILADAIMITTPAYFIGIAAKDLEKLPAEKMTSDFMKKTIGFLKKTASPLAAAVTAGLMFLTLKSIKKDNNENK